MSRAVELRDRLRRYYTTYYRDVLGIPGWSELVGLREEEERQERGRLDRLRRLLGGEIRGYVLNVGCGTGGFNLVAEEAGARVGQAADRQPADAVPGRRPRRRSLSLHPKAGSRGP